MPYLNFNAKQMNGVEWDLDTFILYLNWSVSGLELGQMTCQKSKWNYHKQLCFLIPFSSCFARYK